MQIGRNDSVQSSISARRATENKEKPAEGKSTFNETVIVSDSDEEKQRPKKKTTMTNEIVFLSSVIFEYSRSDMQTLNDIQL